MRGGGGCCHFNWGEQRSFCEVTFEQRPEESGVSHVDVWGKSIPGRGQQGYLWPEAGEVQKCELGADRGGPQRPF